MRNKTTQDRFNEMIDAKVEPLVEQVTKLYDNKLNTVEYIKDELYGLFCVAVMNGCQLAETLYKEEQKADDEQKPKEKSIIEKNMDNEKKVKSVAASLNMRYGTMPDGTPRFVSPHDLDENGQLRTNKK